MRYEVAITKIAVNCEKTLMSHYEKYSRNSEIYTCNYEKLSYNSDMKSQNSCKKQKKKVIIVKLQL